MVMVRRFVGSLVMSANDIAERSGRIDAGYQRIPTRPRGAFAMDVEVEVRGWYPQSDIIRY